MTLELWPNPLLRWTFQVHIKWSDRHVLLHGVVASKIGIGATRNLVIRRCDYKLDEDGIKRDLDHIHNLVLIKVELLAGNCYIRTNSIASAMFARTCLMSRL